MQAAEHERRLAEIEKRIWGAAIMYGLAVTAINAVVGSFFGAVTALVAFELLRRALPVRCAAPSSSSTRSSCR